MLLPLAAALAAGGCGASGSKLTAAQRAQLVHGALAHEPGAAVASVSCGSGDQGGCTVYVRRPGSHRCDGWLAQFDSSGAVAVLGVGHRTC